MSVLIEPEVVINNAFYAKQIEEFHSLEITELRRFSNILYDEISSINNCRIGYKYACLRATQKDMEEFCSSTHNFITGIDKIYCTETIDIGWVEQVNSRYTEDIQSVIRIAREIFANDNLN